MKAIEDCTEAIRLRPSDESYLNRDLAHCRNGDVANARVDFEHVQRQGSTDANRKRGDGLGSNWMQMKKLCANSWRSSSLA